MNSSARKLFATTAILAAEALLLQSPAPEGESADRVGLQDRRSDAELAHTEAEHLPGLDEFRARWSAMVDHAEPVPVVPGIKLVMGVLTRPQDVFYREVLVDTWMKQQGVCKAPRGPQVGCSVYVTFSKGKTLYFFRFALKQYPWATHLGKMDTDVFPKWGTILEGLRHIPDGCETYAGKPWTCQQPDFCPGSECGPPSAGGLFRAADSNNTCWSYMEGGLFIISKNLLAKATEPTGWRPHRDGPEDAVAGRAVVGAADKYNLCVHTWPQEFAQLDVAYFHFWPMQALCGAAGWNEYYSCHPAAGTNVSGTQRLGQ